MTAKMTARPVNPRAVGDLTLTGWIIALLNEHSAAPVLYVRVQRSLHETKINTLAIVGRAR